jgi:hypothetical protein
LSAAEQQSEPVLEAPPRRVAHGDEPPRLPASERAQIYRRLAEVIRGHETEGVSTPKRRSLRERAQTAANAQQSQARAQQLMPEGVPDMLGSLLRGALDIFRPTTAAAARRPTQAPLPVRPPSPILRVLDPHLGLVATINDLGILNERGQPQGQIVQDMVYLENDALTVGIDVRRGGVVGQISSNGMPAPFTGRNLVNVWDCGRLMQQSYYGCSDGSCWTSKPWRWNPGVQESLVDGEGANSERCAASGGTSCSGGGGKVQTLASSPAVHAASIAKSGLSVF